MKLPEGVEIDPITRTITVCGRKLLLGDVDRSSYYPAGYTPSPERVEQVTKMLGRPPTSWPLCHSDPEVVHFSVIVGENGWWLDCAVYDYHGDDDDLDGLEWSWPDAVWQPNSCRAEELLEAIDEAARRPGPPREHWGEIHLPADRIEMSDYDVPYVGFRWTGFDTWDLDTESNNE